MVKCQLKASSSNGIEGGAHAEKDGELESASSLLQVVLSSILTKGVQILIFLQIKVSVQISMFKVWR